MALHLKNLQIIENYNDLDNIPKGKVVINCINAFSYNIAQRDTLFAEVLNNSDYLIPDGISIVMACKWLKAKSKPTNRIVGWDLFTYEMQRLHAIAHKNIYEHPARKRPHVMFMGASESTLMLIRKNMKEKYPDIDVTTYSPPFKSTFSEEDNKAMVNAINAANPDLLWIGMTAPKQEKWAYQHWDELHINCHVGCVGAVFDFFAGTIKRAPQWWLDHSLEWVYRLMKEPKRMWRRSIIGIPLFLYNITKEWIRLK